eukprot:218151-Prymnesium_polylepis.1
MSHIVMTRLSGAGSAREHPPTQPSRSKPRDAQWTRIKPQKALRRRPLATQHPASYRRRRRSSRLANGFFGSPITAA